jgi:hypothetical protein
VKGSFVLAQGSAGSAGLIDRGHDISHLLGQLIKNLIGYIWSFRTRGKGKAQQKQGHQIDVANGFHQVLIPLEKDKIPN